MKFISTLFLLLTFSVAFAQYITPGTGVDWTLDDIVSASPTTMTASGTTYTLLEDLTIASSDVLRIETDVLLEIQAGVQITVNDLASFFISADAVSITAVDMTSPYEGFRFEQGSTVDIQNSSIMFGGGLRVLTENFTLNNCMLAYNVSGAATGATVTLSRGMPVITNNVFLSNANPAISSGANQSVSAVISGNLIEGNNQDNNNRPQINMGGTLASDTLKIIDNTIVGEAALDEVGGIAVANLFGGNLLAIIEGNEITNNRYGITLMGNNTYSLIRNNTLEDNNIQGNPMLGGSGINLNAPTGGMEVDVTGNEIRGNLWGITIQGPVDANLGDDNENPGLNVFSENGNNGEIIAFYNNGPNTISAKHNCWVEDGEGTLAEAENVIYHLEDDSSLGEVVFDPVFCEGLSNEDVNFELLSLHPNPAINKINFRNLYNFKSVSFYSISGQELFTQDIVEGSNIINFNLTAGVYFVAFDGDKHQTVEKLVVK